MKYEKQKKRMVALSALLAVALFTGGYALGAYTATTNNENSNVLSEGTSSLDSGRIHFSTVEVGNDDEMMEILGFKLASWIGVPARRQYVLDGHIAEMEFAWDRSNFAFLRIAVDTDYNINGITNVSFNQEVTIDISEIPVKIEYTMSGPMQASWIKNGYTFNLYMREGESEMSMDSFQDWVGYYVNDFILEPRSAVFSSESILMADGTTREQAISYLPLNIAEDTKYNEPISFDSVILSIPSLNLEKDWEIEITDPQTISSIRTLLQSGIEKPDGGDPIDPPEDLPTIFATMQYADGTSEKYSVDYPNFPNTGDEDTIIRHNSKVFYAEHFAYGALAGCYPDNYTVMLKYATFPINATEIEFTITHSGPTTLMCRNEYRLEKLIGSEWQVVEDNRFTENEFGYSGISISETKSIQTASLTEKGRYRIILWFSPSTYTTEEQILELTVI